jgi:hypothetical protein
MKKTYIAPIVEETLADTEALLADSLPVYTDEVSSEDVLSRETLNGIFE